MINNNDTISVIYVPFDEVPTDSLGVVLFLQISFVTHFHANRNSRGFPYPCDTKTSSKYMSL